MLDNTPGPVIVLGKNGGSSVKMSSRNNFDLNYTTEQTNESSPTIGTKFILCMGQP